MLRAQLLLLVGMFLARPAKAQVIQLDGRPFDCDTAYTNYEMGWCARHLLDSATASMEALLDTIRRGMDRNIAVLTAELDTTRDENARWYTTQQVNDWSWAQADLDTAQSGFLQYARHHRAMVGDLYGFGRERNIAEHMTEYGLVTKRNDELRELLEWYDLR